MCMSTYAHGKQKHMGRLCRPAGPAVIRSSQSPHAQKVKKCPAVSDSDSLVWMQEEFDAAVQQAAAKQLRDQEKKERKSKYSKQGGKQQLGARKPKLNAQSHRKQKRRL